jgi:hypothetical protein
MKQFVRFHHVDFEYDAECYIFEFVPHSTQAQLGLLIWTYLGFLLMIPELQSNAVENFILSTDITATIAGYAAMISVLVVYLQTN